MSKKLAIHNMDKLVSATYFKMGDMISPPFFGGYEDRYWIAFSEYTADGKYAKQHTLNIERTILVSPSGKPYIRMRFITHNIDNGTLNPPLPKAREFKMYLTHLIDPNPLAEVIARLVKHDDYLPNKISRQMLSSYW